MKPTFNAPLLINQVTFLNKYSDAFRRLSAPSSDSPILTFKFSDTSIGYIHLSNRIVQNCSLRTMPTSAETRQGTFKQHNLVYEKWCIKRWFDETDNCGHDAPYVQR